MAQRGSKGKIIVQNWESRYAASDRPMVRVTWWDASQSSGEYIGIEDSAEDYKPGSIDDVVGYLVHEDDEWIVIADSYEADTSYKRQFRSIRNIPKAIVLKIVRLEIAGELKIKRPQFDASRVDRSKIHRTQVKMRASKAAERSARTERTATSEDRRMARDTLARTPPRASRQ